MDQLFFTILALVPLLYVSGFIHEVGHCLVGRAMGYVPTSLGMGTGKPFAVTSWKGTRLYVARSRPLQGLIFLVHPQILPSRKAAAWTMAGGILAHVVLAGVFFVLSRLLTVGHDFLLLAMNLNVALGLGNLLPLSIRMGNAVLRSDGAQILGYLRDGLVETPPTVRTQNVELLRPLWLRIGDYLGLFGHQMAAALAWGELCDHERALRCYEDARTLPLEQTPFVEAYIEFIGAAVHRQAGRLEEARAAQARAADCFRAQQHEIGQLFVELAEGELLLLEGKPQDALEVLDRMVKHPEVRQRPALAASLLANRLAAHLAAGSDQSEVLLKEWERVRLRFPSHTRDCAVLGALGSARRRQGRLDEAALAYERQLKAVQEMYRGLVGLEGAVDFAANHAQVLEEARETLIEANRDLTLTDPEHLFPAPAQLVKEVTARSEAQNRRRHRIGFWWSFANLVLGPVLLVVTVVFWPPAPRVPLDGLPFYLAFLGIGLGMCGILAMLYCLFLQIASRWFAGLRSSGGSSTLVLAAIPWLSWLLVLVLGKG